MLSLPLRRLRRNGTYVLVVGFLVGGCASPGAAPAPAGGGRSRNLITQDEIQQSSARTAFELVQTLRPEYLRSRGMTSASDNAREGGLPVVYVDGVQYGSVASLTNIAPGTIREIRYLRAQDATTRFGTGVANGVIEVITK
jgi:hypothetical protein